MPSLLKEALTACRHSVSDTISFPLSGCFSPFPHGTSSLSVIKEYLGLGSGLPIFRQNFTCSALLENNIIFYLYGTITHYGLTFQIVLVIIILFIMCFIIHCTDGLSFISAFIGMLSIPVKFVLFICLNILFS